MTPLDDIALIVWDLLDRNSGGFEIDDLAHTVRKVLEDDSIDRGKVHRAFEYLRDTWQTDKGRAFITVTVGRRTIYALAQRAEQVLRYHRRRSMADVTRAKRDESNALAALEQYPDDRDVQRLARLRRRMREDLEDVRDEIKEMLNGAI